ncbi:MAG TPA: CaiB/BaiF CoA-transferase family protein [Trebonia sp.]|jgi:crotonobetainyl-CoA:carnitine CoA-transferase CaiB-like acyl-CoA transferase|nr:CaiB/BaiF CoA-transferase family protein [Trebonia sp.]
MILDGVTICELASGVAGPLAALRLSDLGASVVKYEQDGGDYLRGAAPQAPGREDSAAFVALNRGKRSVALGQDLPAAARVLSRAVAAATVVITDWTEADLAAAGLTGPRDEARAGGSGLIWIELSDFGRTGPLTDAPGSELVNQAFAGYPRYLGGYGEPPLRLGADVAATGTGVMAAHAVLATLLWQRREQDQEEGQERRGQVASLSHVGTLLAMKSIHLAAQSDPDSFSGPRVGGANYPPEHGWRAADNYLTFAFGGSVGQTGRAGWTDFVTEIGLGELIDDPRFGDDPTGRLTTGLGPRARELRPEYEKEFTRHPAAEVVALIRAHGGAAAVYQDHRQVLEHEQPAALNLFQEAGEGDDAVRVTAFPARFSRTRTRLRAGAPGLGQHTQEVASELGFDTPDISRLAEAGALAQPQGGSADGR